MDARTLFTWTLHLQIHGLVCAQMRKVLSMVLYGYTKELSFLLNLHTIRRTCFPKMRQK